MCAGTDADHDEKALGWKISDPWKMDYFFVETRKAGEDGINGGLMKRQDAGPAVHELHRSFIRRRCPEESRGRRRKSVHAEDGNRQGHGLGRRVSGHRGQSHGFSPGGGKPPATKSKVIKKAAKK